MKHTFLKGKMHTAAAFLLTASMALAPSIPIYAATGTTANYTVIRETETSIEAVPIGLKSRFGSLKSEITKDRFSPDIKGLQRSFEIKQSKKSKDDPKKEPNKPDYLAGVTAHDGHDGDVTASLKVDDSNVDYYNIGEYTAEVTAVDAAGNEDTKSVDVIITDGKAPSIKIDGKALSAKKKGDKSNYQDKIIIKDNVDDLEDIKVKIDDSKVDYSKYGKYTVTVTATDTAGNKNKKEFTVNIKDKKGPTIKVDKKSFTTTIGVQLDFTPNVTIKDGSGVKEFKIDDSEIDYWTAGKYKLHITATDKAGNTSRKDVKVTVKDPEAEARAAYEAEQAQQAAMQTRAAMVNDRTVYITNTGDKYHSSSCQYTRKSCIPISLSDAQASGYSPCSRCHP